MGKIRGKLWVLAYVFGVGILSSGVTIACAWSSFGDFSQNPSPYVDSFTDPECQEAPYYAPRCGYYMCIGGGCGGYSEVMGCTWATPAEMYQHMNNGCRSESCGGF